MTQPALQTPLHAWHVDHGGKMVDFAGWSMPIQYSTITSEHLATRRNVTLFDVSHMARFRFTGDGAARFLDGLLTRRVTDLKPGRIRYSLVTREDGGILDDVLVYCREDERGSPFFFMVVNASNRRKIADWISSHLEADSGVDFSDQTRQSAMIAVQGPKALATVQSISQGIDLSSFRYFSGRPATVAGHSLFVSRTGYTGEDGFELIVNAEAATDVWKQLMQAGEKSSIVPAGLGARDTLRLEAAMPLYGHELSERINPVQAGLEFALNTKNRSFPGRDVIERARSNTSLPKRIGLRTFGKRVPRQDHPIVDSSRKQLGYVTSGTYSPTLEAPIAMAYVQPDYTHIGSELFIDIRGRLEPAELVPLPFYSRT